MEDDSNLKLKELLHSHQAPGLSAEEKAKMRLHLSDFIEQNPVQKSRFSFFRGSAFLRYRSVLALLAVVVLFSGVSVTSAQSALPGDALYGLKLFVNESLPRVFMSEKEKDEFALVQFENRLEEAAALKEEAPLTAEQEAILQTKFDESLEELSSEDLDQNFVHTKLSTLLEGHEDLFEDFHFSSLEEDVPLDSPLDSLEDVKESVIREQDDKQSERDNEGPTIDLDGDREEEEDETVPIETPIIDVGDIIQEPIDLPTSDDEDEDSESPILVPDLIEDPIVEPDLLPINPGLGL